MPSIFVNSTSTGPYMFIHEVTGTYLETDNYNDDIGQAVQIWNLDPVQKDKGLLGHLWHIEAASESGYFLIKSHENGHSLTAGSSASDYPRLQKADNSEKQQWKLLRVHGSDSIGQDADSYALIPRAYPGHALAPQGQRQFNDVYVVPTSMWGTAPSFSQYWKVVRKSEKTESAAGGTA
ncbi:RICIN domain-containing protein [Streptomyces sp. NPDC021093]|uniref:RICIN domain-containing protein n=1 Tax=Streptomyces sp. NPDC021093 TaxID=3365112 RepID=UPI0037B9A52D